MVGSLMLGEGISGVLDDNALASAGLPAVAQVTATSGYRANTIQVSYPADGRRARATVGADPGSFYRGQPPAGAPSARRWGLSAMFGRRRPPGPDPALLARVSDTTDVDLGTYPEDALAVVGAYPARHALDHRPDGASSYAVTPRRSRDWSAY